MKLCLAYISILLVLGEALLAEDEFILGFNQSYRSETSQDLYKSAEVWDPVLEHYNLTHLRFPGGLISYRYFWNEDSLIGPSTQVRLDAAPEDLSEGKRKKMAGHARWRYPENSLQTFLDFCNQTGTTPVIQLNMMRIASAGKVYPLITDDSRGEARVDEKNWKLAEIDLKNQVNMVYQNCDHVIWELGNEEYHVYPGDIYGQLVVRYLEAFESLDISDPIAVTFGGYSRFTGNGYKNYSKWNDAMIDELVRADALDKVSYFSPHFYFRGKQPVESESELIQRFTQLEVNRYITAWAKHFPSNYTPRFLITEFAAYRARRDDVVFNSRGNALLHASALMQFMADERVAGIFLHGFNRDLNGYILQNNETLRPIAPDSMYISPVIEVTRLIYNAAPQGVDDLVQRGSVLTGKGKASLLLLNLGSEEVPLRSVVTEDFQADKWSHSSFVDLSDILSRQPLPHESFGSREVSNIPGFSLLILYGDESRRYLRGPNE